MVLDRHGRTIRPLVWHHRTADMCDALLERGEWQTGRTKCKRRASYTACNGAYKLCGQHATRVRRGGYDWVRVDGHGRIMPEELDGTGSQP